jgi:hypothetical protein
MKCKKIQRLLPLYISDDLDGPAQGEVKKHIGNCLSCAREYQAHLGALRALKGLENKPDLSDVMKGFTGQVMERIARDPGGPAAPVPRVTYALVPKMLAAAAMLLVVLTAVFFMMGPEDITSPAGGLATEVEGATGLPEPGYVEGILSTNVAHEEGGEKDDLFKKLDPDEIPELIPLDERIQHFPKVIPVKNPHDL